MFDFFIGTAPARTHSLSQRGLTPNDSRALMALRREDGQTMGALAQLWECDPANATWVIDRLERLGYAARQPSPRDRRAKLVVLTPEGARVKTAITQEFYSAPSALLALDSTQLEELERVFKRLTAEAQPFDQRVQTRRRHPSRSRKS